MIIRHTINKQNTSQIGRESLTPDGLRLTVAANIRDQEILVRDFSAPDWKVKNLGHTKQDPEKIAAGVMNIRANRKMISTGKGIYDFDLNEKGGDVFLLGSGGSLRSNLGAIGLLSKYGATIGTNRSLKAFIGRESCLDYAFFLDAQLDIITQENWWSQFSHQKTRGIFAFHAHPSATGANWLNRFWFGLCAGNVEEFDREEKTYGFNRDELGTLDSGFASIFSQLHLCFRQRVKRVFLLGHDFSFVDYLEHFDRKYKIDQKQLIKGEDFAFDVLPDINGETVLTQRYLVRTAQLVAFACKNLVEIGIEVYNMSGGGILRADWIKRMTADQYLESKSGKNFENEN